MEWDDSSTETTVIVRGAAGEAKLWLGEDGELHDAIGPVRVYEGQGGRAATLPPEELAVFVAEWLSCAIEQEGPVALHDIHPKLRALVYELTPSALEVSDDDAIDVVLS
jgi:hypothetical protein